MISRKQRLDVNSSEESIDQMEVVISRKHCSEALIKRKDLSEGNSIRIGKQ